MKTITQPIGIHIRLEQGLHDVIDTVDQLDLVVVQSFLISEKNKYVSLTDKAINNFIQAKKDRDFLYYVHAAYWSGITDSKSKMFVSFKKEVEIAQDLQSNGIVVHPGAVKKGSSQIDSVQYIAECVNELNHLFPNIEILLENGPHAGRTFGGDLDHFVMLQKHIEQKDRVGFCIDTAHAFVYGYDLVEDKQLNLFFQILQESFNSRIKLLHFNDSKEKCGSYIDKHEIPGHGMIGEKVLQNIMNHDLFQNVPLIMECSKENSADSHIIAEVASWKD